MSDCAARLALRRLSESVSRLGSNEDGKTLFEGSPSRSQVCFDAWMELHSAQKEAREVLATSCPPAALALTRQQENYIKNLRFYADQARSNDWHTDGHIIDWRVIRQTLIECADALERMTDLVRYQRHELFQEELITESEYADLVRHEGAVSRIEGYDAMRCALRSLRDAVNAKLNRAGEPSGSLEAALTHADAVLAREAQ